MPWQITSFSEVQVDFRVAAVAERRGIGAVVAQVLVADPVEFVGGDARRNGGARGGQRISRDATGDPHLLDRLGGLDVRLAGAGRRRLVDVFGTLDAGGHRTSGRDDLGSVAWGQCRQAAALG